MLRPDTIPHRQAALGLGGPASTSTPRALRTPTFTSAARLCPTQEPRRGGAEALGSSSASGLPRPGVRPGWGSSYVGDN